MNIIKNINITDINQYAQKYVYLGNILSLENYVQKKISKRDGKKDITLKYSVSGNSQKRKQVIIDLRTKVDTGYYIIQLNHKIW